MKCLKGPQQYQRRRQGKNTPADDRGHRRYNEHAFRTDPSAPALPCPQEPDLAGYTNAPEQSDRLRAHTLAAPEQCREAIVEGVGALDEPCGDDNEDKAPIDEQRAERGQTFAKAQARLIINAIGREKNPDGDRRQKSGGSGAGDGDRWPEWKQQEPGSDIADDIGRRPDTARERVSEPFERGSPQDRDIDERRYAADRGCGDEPEDGGQCHAWGRWQQRVGDRRCKGEPDNRRPPFAASIGRQRDQRPRQDASQHRDSKHEADLCAIHADRAKPGWHVGRRYACSDIEGRVGRPITQGPGGE
jgi:hypothetical protein